MTHPNQMSKEELLALVHDMGTLALDLAQHLDFTAHLKPDAQENAYRRAVQMAYDLCNYPYAGERLWRSSNRMEIAVFGKNGLRVERG